jgi:hypothetical protein
MLAPHWGAPQFINLCAVAASALNSGEAILSAIGKASIERITPAKAGST